MQPQKENRATMSCTECQRRKQKCSREWPCNHCQARKIPQLCQFFVKRAQQESLPASARASSSSNTQGVKRRALDSAKPHFVKQNDEYEVLEDGLKAWGYMSGHIHYRVWSSEDISSPKNSPAQGIACDAVQKVLRAVPPRSITDAIVNHFLNTVNYRYSAIYGPSLAEKYVQWWADRSASKKPSPEFTCLLLRICAYSVQYLTTSLCKMIEFELSCTSQTLTERFSAAAEELSRSFEASRTSIERVGEQFLKCAWLKSESKIVESWHTLSCTIRKAQELGIDRDAGIDVLSEFDIEIRRRIWSILYIWDWQMSAWLGRPNLINQKNLSFKFPNLRLDQSTTEPNLLSPFAHMALQAHLGQRVATVTGDATSKADLSAEKVLEIEDECQKFIDELPAIFRVKNPDISFDEAHPYFIFQRHQLHCVIFLTMLDFFKTYLTREREDKLSDQDDKFRKKGIEIALHLLEVVRKLLDHEFPMNAKFHMVVFCIFDTATLLCSAIIHDREHMLPHRDKVIEVIDSSLDRLYQLSLSTKLGATSYNFLFKLVQATPSLRRHLPIDERQKQDGIPVPKGSPPAHELEPVAITRPPGLPLPYRPPPILEVITQSSVPATGALAMMPISDALAFGVDQFLALNPFGSFGDPNAVDMGGMEPIWAWHDLHPNAYTHSGGHSTSDTTGRGPQS
ncbi:hypothetical protein COCCADRAFT_31537 [Bipolaris zeicola 26-R-13]|uniref:Zn(2)-C6 fungal-type domain-containing protein n=1 Tax=Cochliobolus carbonum (strain 26-R-13) TaxID=930089 RepID=W6XMM1_COCC2|nr:uncharacterized protein COCCADRAFT_31537 [Bipolaris zeicola 26-R-13]EUC26758.1 hypothetical protein COCCADRAFT_31537 [Bipolaris zeicola 26-R-13]